MPGPENAVARHPNRAQIELALLAGAPIAELSRRFNVPSGALFRWRNRRMLPAVRFDASEPSGIEPLEQLLELTEQLREQRRAVFGSSLYGRAASSELRALDLLLNRLGISDAETAESLRAGRALGRAVGNIAREHPELGQIIARELVAVGARELAADLLGELPTEGDEP